MRSESRPLGQNQQGSLSALLLSLPSTLPESPNQEFGDGNAGQSPPILDNSDPVLPREIAAGILISPQINVLGQKPSILAPLVAFIYQFGRIQAEETRSDNRILRLREEKESGDKESQ